MATESEPPKSNDLQWTSKEKRIFAGIAAVIVLAGALWAWGSTSLYTLEVCTRCLSSRTTHAWGIGRQDGEKFFAVQAIQTLQRSELADLLPGSHAHRWYRETVSTTVFGARRYRGCTGMTPNPVASAFEMRHPFRAFVRARMEAGSLTSKDLGAMIEIPERPRDGFLDEPVRRALVERAQELLDTGGVGADETWKNALLFNVYGRGK